MRKPRKAMHAPKTDQNEPRRSSRLARKRVTIETQEKAHNPEQLSYYMEVVEQGNAGRWCGKPRYGMEDRDTHDQED